MQSEKDYNIVYEHFCQFLKVRKLKRTPERFAILRAVFKIEVPFQIRLLRKYLIEHKYYISKVTLYNNVRLLEECGIIYQLLINNKIHYYTKSDVISCFVIQEKEKKEIKLDRQIEEMLLSFFKEKYKANMKSCMVIFQSE